MMTTPKITTGLVPTKGDREKVLFLVILVGLIITAGFVWGTWRAGPPSTQTTSVATEQQIPGSVLETLVSFKSQPATPSKSALETLVSFKSQPSTPSKSALETLASLK